MNRIAAFTVATTLTLGLSGCMHQIKLDPDSDGAMVYIDGHPKGRGMVDHYVPAQYGYPEGFGVRVEPKTDKAYTVEIKRELDMPRAVVQTTVAAGVGLAYTAIDLANGRVPVTGLLAIAYAPLSWLSSYYYKGYYDLSKERRKEEKAL